MDFDYKAKCCRKFTDFLLSRFDLRSNVQNVCVANFDLCFRLLSFSFVFVKVK